MDAASVNHPAPRYFEAIAAMAENRVIGRGNQIPWHLPADFRWFKQLTTGHILVMGRRTFESIGKPLPQRLTCVLSRSLQHLEGARVIRDLADLDPAEETRRIFICGGAEVYALALPFCSDLYLTHVKRVTEGDVLFPAFEDRFQFVATLQDNDDFRVAHYRNPSPRRPRAGS